MKHTINEFHLLYELLKERLTEEAMNIIVIKEKVNSMPGINKIILKNNSIDENIKGLPQPTILLKIKFPKNCLFESNKFINKREIHKDGFMEKVNKIFTFANNELFMELKNTDLRVF